MPLTYDKSSARYRATNGRFISAKIIRDEIEKSVIAKQREIKQLSQQLIDGKINLPKWQLEMKDQIKNAHIVNAAVARGGHRQMTPQDWGRTGARLKEQYKYLNNFARQIANETINPVAIPARATSYLSTARTHFYREEQLEKSDSDLTRARRLVRSGESCHSCRAWAARGFISIEKMPPVGTLEPCRSYCKCIMEYQ